MRLSRMILFFLIGVFVSQCVYYYPNLPEIMASHFDGAGKPNGWMSKQSFFLLEVVILGFIILEFTFLPWIIGKMPNRLINMPNKEFWFAEERRTETINIIQHFFEWFSAGLLALFVSVNQLVFRANLTGENLSSYSWLILGAFLFFVVIWLIKFLRRFRNRKNMKIELTKIAHARSGDKGDTANVGLIALKDEFYPILEREITAEKVKAHFGAMVKGAVERFELPNLKALNFLLHESLGGGGTLSLMTDAQGKTFSTGLLRMMIDLEDSEAENLGLK